MGLTQVSEKGIKDGEILNADINASAAIAGTKISTDFGSQDITTTGNASVGETVTVTGNNPNITFTDSNNNPDFKIYGSNGSFSVLDSTNSATRFAINSTGNIDIGGNLDVGSGIDVTGNSNLDGKLTITQSNSTIPEIELDGDGPNFIRFNDDAGGTNGMDLVFRSSPNTIGFETSDNNTPRFTVNYNGQASFSSNLDVGGGLDVTGNINLTGELNMIAGSDGQRFFDARVGSSALTFRGTTGGDANHQELARFFRGGGCELNHNGNKKFETYTDGVQVTGVLRGTTSGFGIDFAETSNASGMSSEVLDDYEEGTWTPIFADASSGGVASSSYTHQVGWYTKIGNLVNVQGRLSGCDTTGLTGSHAFYIRNLPYAMESSSHRLITGSALCSNINIDSDTKSIGVLANVGSSANTWFRFFQVKDNASWTILPVSTVPDGNNEFLWNFSYRVA